MSARKAIAYSYLDRYVSLTIFFLTSMIIARLLTPNEIGIFSITMVIIGFIGPFRDLGASQYLIKEKDLTVERIRSVWTAQLGIGLLFSLLILTMQYPVAHFYREPKISDIMLIISINSLLIPFGALTSAWLTRELLFNYIAIIRLSSTCAGSLTSIYFAYMGHGPISLAYGSLATTLTTAIVSIFFRPSFFPWLPGIKELKRVLGFGVPISGVTFMNVFYSGTPELILGRMQGMYVTGLLSRAQGLVAMFQRLITDAIYATATSIFAKINREQGDLCKLLMKGISFTSVLGWTLLFFIAIQAHPIINVLYGNQWNEAVDIARLLCLSTCFSIPILLIPSLLMIKDHVKPLVWLTVTNVFLQVLFSCLGASISLKAIAWAIMLCSICITSIWLYVTQPIIAFAWRELGSTLAKSLAVAMVSMLIPLTTLYIYGLTPDSHFPPLIISALGMMSGFLIAIKKLNHPIWVEFDDIFLKRFGLSKYIK